jgi:hypothetical protein
MIKATFLISFVFFFNNVFSQTSGITIDPIEKWIRRFQKEGTIVYTEKSYDWGITQSKRVLKKRKVKVPKDEYFGYDLKLSMRERKYLLKQLDSSSNYTWENNLFSNSKRISIDSVSTFIDNHIKNLKRTLINDSIQRPVEVVLMEDYSMPNIFIFSKPIVFRNNTFYMFYIGWRLGHTGGTDEILFYKKVNNEWVKWTVANKIWY